MIKVVMLDTDEKYLTMISKAFMHNFNKKIELYTFTSKDIMLNSVDFNNIHVLITNHQLFDLDNISQNISKAYFCESKDIEFINGYKTVNKYQKINDIYQIIETLYFETAGYSKKSNKFSDKTTLLTYTSFCGGTGTSTIAIAEAISKANNGYKVLYLNLEYFDTTDIYFSNTGEMSFSHLVFEIKRKDIHLSTKLEKIFQHDEKTNVYYCVPSKILLDKIEINNEIDITTLFDGLKSMDFDYIIIDRNISFTPEERIIYKLSDSLRFVVDGRKITVLKFLKLMNSLGLIDERENANICDKVGIIYNKMSSIDNNTIQDKNIKVLATIHKYKSNDERIILNEIVSKGILGVI